MVTYSSDYIPAVPVKDHVDNTHQGGPHQQPSAADNIVHEYETIDSPEKLDDSTSGQGEASSPVYEEIATPKIEALENDENYEALKGDGESSYYI